MHLSPWDWPSSWASCWMTDVCIDSEGIRKVANCKAELTVGGIKKLGGWKVKNCSNWSVESVISRTGNWQTDRQIDRPSNHPTDDKRKVTLPIVLKVSWNISIEIICFFLENYYLWDLLKYLFVKSMANIMWNLKRIVRHIYLNSCILAVDRQRILRKPLHIKNQRNTIKGYSQSFSFLVFKNKYTFINSYHS